MENTVIRISAHDTGKNSIPLDEMVNRPHEDSWKSSIGVSRAITEAEPRLSESGKTLRKEFAA